MSVDSLKNLSPEEIHRLEVLSKIGKRINTPERFSEALRAVLEAVVESMEAERGALFLVETEASVPTLKLSIDVSIDKQEEVFGYSSTVVEKVWKELKPIAEFDAKENEAFAGAASIQAEGIRSIICVPLVGRESNLGVLYLDNRISEAFTKADLQMLDVIADLASTALERARFFDALQSLNSELEERVAQRTAEAEAARIEAERATMAKSLFLAKMSHELRTPLNGVLGLTEDLAEKETRPVLKLQLEQVVESARSLSALINGVLDYSKLESNEMTLDEHDFDLEQAISATLVTVNYAAAKKGLELQVWIDPAVPEQIRADSTRIKQILINLLSNAVKFTHQGFVRLLVSSSQAGLIRFTVADSGVGIAPDKQSLVFRPFIQADTSTTREYGGTGLGLSICHSLCSLLGGRLELHSEVGQGSRFTFQIPVTVLKAFRPPDYLGLAVWLSIPSAPQKQAMEKALKSWNCKIVEQPELAELALCSNGETRVDLPTVWLLEPGETWSSPTAPSEQSHFLITPVTRRALIDVLQDILQPALNEPSPPESGKPEPVGGGYILVAEDHEINRLVIEKMLRTWGYQCVFAADGPEAAATFVTSAPRMILMDIEMPGQDGFATARKIRAHAATQGSKDNFVPIIAVTAHLASDLRHRCLAAGMDDLLTKPLSRKDLKTRLDRWEQVLQKEVSRSEVRHGDFPELEQWPGCFLGDINSKLSTLAAACRSEPDVEILTTAVQELEALSFSAGLLHWGGRLAALDEINDLAKLSALIQDFQQEWRHLAPTLML